MVLPTTVMDSQTDRLCVQVLVGLPHHHVFGNVWWRRGSTINIIVHNSNTTVTFFFFRHRFMKTMHVNEIHCHACLVSYDINVL